MEYCSAGRVNGLNKNQFLSCFLITLKIFGFFFICMPIFFVCTASHSCFLYTSLVKTCYSLLHSTQLKDFLCRSHFFSPLILVFLTGNFSHTHTRRGTVYISSDVYKVKLRHNMICLDVRPIVALCGANVGRKGYCVSQW